MHILKVSEINAYLQELLESDDVLRDIWVEGEISNFNAAASGHCYFSLKQGDTVINAVMWRGHASKLPALPRNGDAVLAHGYVSLYAASGRLQFYADTIRAAGVGLLHARFEELKARLGDEGLFDPSRKRPLPLRPRRVGVVTSASGAALRDILTVLGRRYPLAEVLLSPSLVQGEQAPESIVEALYALYACDVDVIIVARGGGAIEDLWAFNEEIVARAIVASPVPLVTGVGHETDTTIADYVADVRAPTPSAAAEITVPDQAELAMALASLRQNLAEAALAGIYERQQAVGTALDALHRHNPVVRLAQARQRIDELLRRSESHLKHNVALQRARLNGIQAQLAALSPQATIERGYAVVRRAADGTVVTRADQAAAGERLAITVRSGRITADVVAGLDESKA